MVLFSFLVNTLSMLLWRVPLPVVVIVRTSSGGCKCLWVTQCDATSFIYFYKFIESSVTRVQYLPGADLGQTCPDMTTRAHTCRVCRWAKVFCLH